MKRKILEEARSELLNKIYSPAQMKSTGEANRNKDSTVITEYEL